MDDPTPASADALPRSWLRLPAGARLSGHAMHGVLWAAAAFVLVVVAAIVYVLAASTFGVHIHLGDPDSRWHLWIDQEGFFEHVSFREFFTGTEWRSAGTVEIAEGRYGEFGVLPLVAGTLLVAVGASAIGLPLGLASAVYLAEYASPRVRAVAKPAIELLAGIPSIVFGFVALLIVSPITQRMFDEGTIPGRLFGEAQLFSGLNAIIVVGVMVLPIVTSLSEDALRAVPQHLREASLAVGATRWETTRHVVVPAALSGITASFILAVTRAVGETMAVAMAAGTQANLTINPVEALQTMTGFIALRTSGDTPHDGPVYLSLFAVGLALFVMTLLLNLVAARFVRRFREVDS